MLRTRIRAGAPAGIVLSVVFAALLTLVFASDLVIRAATGHLELRFGDVTPVTLRVPNAPRFVQASPFGPALRYEQRRVVVPRGTTLDANVLEHRLAVAHEALHDHVAFGRFGRVMGVGAIYLTLSLLLTTYMRRYAPSAARLLRAQVGVFVLLFAALSAAKALLIFTTIPVYWLPFAVVPLWGVLYLDRRTAFMLNVVVAFFAASLVRFDILLLGVVLVRGMASSLAFTDRKHPRQMILAGLLGGGPAAVIFAAASLAFDAGFSVAEDLARPAHSMLLACAGGGVLAGLFAFGLREIAERVLGAVGRDRLLDLVDLEQPLLQKMAREAPGSWEHSRAMANLAEAAASAIGADALLVRAGAYYHDLGKSVQPKYFVENLSAGEPSPHEELEPHVSADAIMAHVVEGTKILRQGGVPEPVVEFAYTHHGSQVVEYFWHKHQERGNPEGLVEDDFRYPGMKPRTRETAILMLVDSIEAASRTIDPPERAKFEEMIQRVVFGKLRSGQLDESGLSTEDLRRIVGRTADTLVNAYHGRIKYPWQRDAEKREAERRDLEKADKKDPRPSGGMVVRLPPRS
jgi:hypothetical protein